MKSSLPYNLQATKASGSHAGLEKPSLGKRF